MMLEAGSNPRVKNKGGVTPLQLVDPSNTELKDVIRRHEFALQNAGDYVNVEDSGPAATKKGGAKAAPVQQEVEEDDDDAEFSGSDEEERAEWERARKQRPG
jgi:hypothetical protein